MDKLTEAKTTERGWPAHHICRTRCVFHRNTLIEYGNTRIIVSTVGNFRAKRNGKEIIDTVGHDRYYETLVFGAVKEEGYWEIDGRQFDVNGKWSIDHCEYKADAEANRMHDNFVKRLVKKLKDGKAIKVY